MPKGDRIMIDISKEITKALSEYTKEVEEGMQEAQTEVAKEGVKKLKNNSPKETGEYARGWRSKKTKRGRVIHNATKPQITHLLEKGYPKRGGGRVPAKVHIAPVEEWAIEEYEKRVEKVIRG